MTTGSLFMSSNNKPTTHNKTHMKIEKAIEMLKEAQKHGAKNIILAYWEADMFERKDDESWEIDSEYVENEMDWSMTHDRIQDLIFESESINLAINNRMEH